MLLRVASLTSLAVTIFRIGAGFPPAAGAAAVLEPVFAADGDDIGFLAGAAPAVPVFRTSPADAVVVELVLETTDVRLVVALALATVVVDETDFWVVV